MKIKAFTIVTLPNFKYANGPLALAINIYQFQLYDVIHRHYSATVPESQGIDNKLKFSGLITFGWLQAITPYFHDIKLHSSVVIDV